MKKLLPLLTLAVLLLGACQDGELPTAVTPIHPPSFNISDGMNSGNLHFFFLPPMVGSPTYSGTFDGSLSPVVEICQWTTSGCATPLVAQYTTTAGPGSETVRVDATSEQYVVNWHTDQFSLNLDHTYRIRVLVAGTPLGYADVKLYSSGKAANTTTSTEIALVDGKTLPIKFRVELGAVYVVQPAQAGDPPAVLTSIDGNVSMSLPAGSISEPIGITIEPITPPADAPTAHVVAGTTHEFGPHGTQFASPITATLRYDPTKLPLNRKEESLRLATYVNGQWEWVPGSEVDPVNNTVSGDLHHFSTYAVASMRLIAMAGAESYIPGCGFYTMYEDQSDFQAQIDVDQPVTSLSWSPDGTKLAYVAHNGLYVTDGAVTSLITGSAHVLPDSRPTWSPDGSQIAFQGFENIFTVRADGSTAPVQITHVSGYWAFDPSWSRDGSRIVYSLDSGSSSWEPAGQAEIYTMKPDGSDNVRLTMTARTEWSPVYSPDGSKLAFVALNFDTGTFSLEVMDVATGVTSTAISGHNLGRTQHDLLHYRVNPRWTHDGRILFSAFNQWDMSELWLINPDGTGQEVLIHSWDFMTKSAAVCGGVEDTPGAFADWQP